MQLNLGILCILGAMLPRIGVLNVILRKPLITVFLNCVRVKRVWHRFSPILSALLSSTFVRNWVSVFFFNWQTINQKNARIARYLVKSILYGIWKFRDKCTFYNGTERSDALIRHIIQDVKARINIDFFPFFS